METKLNITSTACMPEDRFWKLVELANWPCDYEKMRIKYLKMLSKDECKSFRNTLSVARNMLDNVTDDLDLCVGDDGYNDLIHHVVGMGKEQFFKHLNEPNLIAKRAYDRKYDSETCAMERYAKGNIMKAEINSLQDFESYWEKRDNDFLKLHPIITAEEAKEYRKELIQEISSEFKEGDTIVHYDDYGIATPRLEHESLLLKRNGKVIKSVLIRMS